MEKSMFEFKYRVSRVEPLEDIYVMAKNITIAKDLYTQTPEGKRYGYERVKKLDR